MRKQPIGLDDVRPAPPTRRLPRSIVALALAAVSAPIAYEGLLLCVANWKAALGMSTDVHTPVLDASQYYLERIRDEIAGLILPWFQHVPWQPSYVLLAACVTMTVSMLMLRR